jgi:hypothetical protein
MSGVMATMLLAAVLGERLDAVWPLTAWALGWIGYFFWRERESVRAIWGLGSKVAMALGAEDEDVATGDAALDSRLLLKGPRNVVLGALDLETRRDLLHLADQWSLRIAGDRFEIETRRPYIPYKRLLRSVHELTELARRAAARGPLLERLRQNALHDPMPEVRLRNLDALASDKAHGPDVLRAALDDENEKVRLCAARGLGREGDATLLRLATSPTTAEDCAVDAVRGLGAALQEPQAVAILDGALGRRRLALARATADRLAQCGTVAAVPLLRAASDDDTLGFSLRRAVGQAIARIQSRLEGAEAGQLAVADGGDAGQVSLADSTAGQLSLDQPARSSDPETQ